MHLILTEVAVAGTPAAVGETEATEPAAGLAAELAEQHALSPLLAPIDAAAAPENAALAARP